MSLEAAGLRLQYGDKVVADNMTVAIDKAEIISIIGPNGSGKSTLLKALGRLLKPSSGTVLLDGKDIQLLNPAEVAKKMAILPQTTAAPGDMTVEDLVWYGRMPHHSMFVANKQERDKQAIMDALQATGLMDMRFRRLATLSGGERQRAWLAMAIAQQPRILLLDEPTTYLDIRYQLELMKLVVNLHKKFGITVIMVLHDLNHAARFSQRLIAVKQGKIVADGAVENIFTEAILSKLYDVSTSVVTIKHDDAEHLVCLPHDVCVAVGA